MDQNNSGTPPRIQFRHIPHFPFVPALAASGLSLFDVINGRLAGSRFESVEEFVRKVTDIANFISHVT
jgi:hypothetical protein